MRRYETVVIVDSNLPEKERPPLFDRLKEMIIQEGGFLITFDEWGDRKLAYEIKKRSRGYYIHLDYCGTGALVDEMERFLRIDERALKYMTVVLDKDVDIEDIKEKMTEAEGETTEEQKGKSE